MARKMARKDEGRRIRDRRPELEKDLPKVSYSLSSCDLFKVPPGASILRDIIKASRMGKKQETLRLLGILIENPFIHTMSLPNTSREILNLIDVMVLRRFYTDREEIRRIRNMFEERLPLIRGMWKMPPPELE